MATSWGDLSPMHADENKSRLHPGLLANFVPDPPAAPRLGPAAEPQLPVPPCALPPANEKIFMTKRPHRTWLQGFRPGSFGPCLLHGVLAEHLGSASPGRVWTCWLPMSGSTCFRSPSATALGPQCFGKSFFGKPPPILGRPLRCAVGCVQHAAPTLIIEMRVGKNVALLGMLLFAWLGIFWGQRAANVRRRVSAVVHLHEQFVGGCYFSTLKA